MNTEKMTSTADPPARCEELPGIPRRPDSAGPDIVRHKLVSNSLDELDTLNHYCFGGCRDMSRQFRILTVNDGSEGEESLFLAAQLMGTDSMVVHYDPSPLVVERVRRRAEQYGLLGRIRFTSGSLVELLASLRSKSQLLAVRQGEKEEKAIEYGPFDYVRCCGAFDRAENPHDLFELTTRFLKEDGVLGVSCFARYGREPYRQMQALAKLLDDRRGRTGDTIALLKEFMVFAPTSNWTRMAFDQLSPEIRRMKDEAFFTEFLREDGFAPSIVQLYDLLDARLMDIACFARETRFMYQPWFAQNDRKLADVLKDIAPRDIQAVSEIAWGNIERHLFWASRGEARTADPGDPDNIPFFNHFSNMKRSWSTLLRTIPEDGVLTIEISIGEDCFSLTHAWNAVLRRFIELLDGYKTLGEIALVIREETRGEMGIDEILRTITLFMHGAALEDILLLRHKNTPLLPFTASHLRAA